MLRTKSVGYGLIRTKSPREAQISGISPYSPYLFRTPTDYIRPLVSGSETDLLRISPFKFRGIGSMGYLETALAIWGDCRIGKSSVLGNPSTPYGINGLNEVAPSADDDWPESWRGDFDSMKAANIKLGFHPGVAAELAYENLKARAACPWRAEVAGWPDERREAWGRRAAHLQDAGTNWRDAECEAYEAEDRHDSLGKNRR